MRTLRLTTTEDHRGRRLDAVVGEWLGPALGRPLSRGLVRRLLMAGAIGVAGRPVRAPGRLLVPGVRLEARVRTDLLPAGGGAAFAPGVLEVLYEDDLLIAVNKPPGVPTHAGADARRPHLVGLVQALLASRSAAVAAGAPYLGVHQRLDRDTSGVVLFAKDRAANPGLAAAFAGREVVKTYVALVARPVRLPPSSWVVEDVLGRVGRGRGARTGRVDEGGEPARTAFRCVEVLRGALVVEARPTTGRKHQIRAHLAEAGLPILGDTAYGAPARPEAPRVLLHAARLELCHPRTGAPLRLEAPLPDDFRRALEGLRAGVSGARGGTRRR